jgi:hypothetical protein
VRGKSAYAKSIVPANGFWRSSGTVTVPQRAPVGHDAEVAGAVEVAAMPPIMTAPSTARARQARNNCDPLICPDR